MVLGLSLAERAVFASQRAGFGEVMRIGEQGRGIAETAALSWADIAPSLPSGQSKALAIAPAGVLAETDWLAPLAARTDADAAWAARPGKLILVAAASSRQALRALDEAGATDFGAVYAELSRRFRLPASMPGRDRSAGYRQYQPGARGRTAPAFETGRRPPTASWRAMSSDRSPFRFRVTVELNGEILERESFATTQVKDGDEVEFLYFMGGGK